MYDKKPAYYEPSYFSEGVVIAIMVVLGLLLVGVYQGFLP
jgi:hypothetical protein